MKYILDGKKMVSREEAHAYLKDTFGFPDYYGTGNGNHGSTGSSGVPDGDRLRSGRHKLRFVERDPFYGLRRCENPQLEI